MKYYKQNTDIDALLGRHFALEPLTEKEETQLYLWISANAPLYERLKRLLGVGTQQAEEVDFNIDSAWKKVEGKLRSSTTILDMGRRQVRMMLYTAACVSAVIVCSVFLFLHAGNDKQKNYANMGQAPKELVLSDGSHVMLYPRAKFTFSDGEKRQATLSGRAFFKIKRDRKRPFLLTAKELNIEVLGTSFLVEASAEATSGVYVSNGTVRVSTKKNTVIITQNEQAEIIDGQLRKTLFNRNNENEQISLIVFNNTPIAQAVQDIEKKTGLRIDLDERIKRNRISTKINTKAPESIVQELAIICGCACDTIIPGQHYRLYYE